MSTPDTLTRELAALDDALAGRPVDPDLADLAELAVALRGERLAPDPAFTRTLDSRVERGFPRAAAARTRRGIKWPRITLPALGVAASVLVVVGIAVTLPTGSDNRTAAPSGAGSNRGGTAATEQAAPPDTGSAAKRAPSSSGGSAASDSATPALSTPPNSAIAPLPTPSSPAADRRGHRSVERSAELVLATPPRDIDRAAAEILRVTDDLGGYVVSSSVSSNSSGQFELRVPERRLQAALSRLSRVAKVRQRTQNAQDITGAVVSVSARLKDARTERSSLLRQLAKATTTNQTASIRARLRLVSGEIAGYKRDLSRVKTRASRSTIAVTLLADRKAAAGSDGGAWTPGDALDDATRILEVTAGVLLVAVALLLPLGLVGLLVWLAARQAAQRRRERALDAV
ncbi:MAG: hypothetical protein QOC68_2564 [Solirubrobacteraceae bacterium]|jgi:hypothetical protein|nr:hypothetical protein [Solirubrobacteraceae bacterium]